MKNLIIYTSRHGCIGKCARKLKELLDDETVIVNLNTGRVPDLKDFDTLILGASIYMGKVQKEMFTYITENLSTLLKKEIVIFISSFEATEKKHEQFRKAFTPELYDHSSVKGVFGDEVNYKKCSFIEKVILFLLKGIRQSYSNIDVEKLKEL